MFIRLHQRIFVVSRFPSGWDLVFIDKFSCRALLDNRAVHVIKACLLRDELQS